MPESYDSLAKRLRRKVYKPDEAGQLAKDFVEGMAAISRQPEVERGLKSTTIADVQGGTTLGVGDPAATHVSDVLVQNPNPGLPHNVGSGLSTRRQSRIRTVTRVLPAKIMEDVSPGQQDVSVTIVADEPGKAIDPTTGIEVVGEAAGEIANGVSSIVGLQITAKMTGQPVVSAGSTGIQPISAGKTVQVALNESYEDTTTWTRRGRKNLPVITPVLKSRSAVLVNGFAQIGEGGICVIFYDAPNDNLFTDARYPDGDDWVWDGSVLDSSYAGRPWGAFVIGTDQPSGTVDMRSAIYPYYDYGVVDGSGGVTFTGIPWSFAFANNYYSEVTSNPLAQVFLFFFAVGCATGQNVNFGPATLNYAWADASLHRTWNVIDSNFPIPL